MFFFIFLFNFWAFAFAFPQRNQDQQPDVFSQRESSSRFRQATRLNKYVPIIDGKPILIPGTEPEKRENHVYDAEAEKAFLQSYLFPPTEHAGKENPVKYNEKESKVKPKQRRPFSDSPNHRSNLEGSADDEYDSPVVLESLNSDEYDSPIVVENLMKEGSVSMGKDSLTKQKIETDKILPRDEYDKPVVVQSLVKKVNPNENIQYKDEDYDKPLAIEAVVKKPYQTKGDEFSDYDTPVVIEALVKKDSTNIKPAVLSKGKSKYDEHGKLSSEALTKNSEIKDDDYKEYVYASEKENEYSKVNSKGTKLPVVNAFTKKDVSKVNDNSKPSSIKTPNSRRKAHKLKPTQSSVYIKHKGHADEVEPLGGRATQQLDETSPNEMSIEGATSSRNFFPLDPNVWSLLTSIQSQERRKFQPCETANAQAGNCIPIQLCPVPASSVDELLSNVCVIDEVFVGFCCPEFPVETVNVQWEGLPLTHTQEGAVQKNSSGCGSVPKSTDAGTIWPWLVTLVTTSNEVFCSGAVIGERVILAAAHCTKRIPLNQIVVRVRSMTTPLPFEQAEVVEIKRHAQYNPKTMLNDLALLKLSKKLESATPICLPDTNKDYEGENGILLGWKAARGDATDVELLPMISKEACRKLGFSESILCSEPRAVEGACNADAGAPLVVNVRGQFTLLGVLTWNRHECDGPTSFTRIASFRKWITKHSTDLI